MVHLDLLYRHLQEAITKLQKLISFTQQDIEDIKVANHEVIFERSREKIHIIKEFETSKGMIDKEIRCLTQTHPHLKIAQILDKKADSLLADMRKKLEELKSLNTHYARMVFAVSEFYTSIADKLIPREKADYKSQTEQSRLLKIQA